MAGGDLLLGNNNFLADGTLFAIGQAVLSAGSCLAGDGLQFVAGGDLLLGNKNFVADGTLFAFCQAVLCAGGCLAGDGLQFVAGGFGEGSCIITAAVSTVCSGAVSIFRAGGGLFRNSYFIVRDSPDKAAVLAFHCVVIIIDMAKTGDHVFGIENMVFHWYVLFQCFVTSDAFIDAPARQGACRFSFCFNQN